MTSPWPLVFLIRRMVRSLCKISSEVRQAEARDTREAFEKRVSFRTMDEMEICRRLSAFFRQCSSYFPKNGLTTGTWLFNEFILATLQH